MRLLIPALYPQPTVMNCLSRDHLFICISLCLSCLSRSHRDKKVISLEIEEYRPHWLFAIAKYDDNVLTALLL